MCCKGCSEEKWGGWYWGGSGGLGGFLVGGSVVLGGPRGAASAFSFLFSLGSGLWLSMGSVSGGPFCSGAVVWCSGGLGHDLLAALG